MTDDRTISLVNTIKDGAESRDKWLNIFSAPAPASEIIQRGAGIAWYDHERFALKAFFIDQDIALAKQHFYMCGRLDEFLITKFDEKILDYGINHLSYALLSDDIPLIKRYSDLRYRNYGAAVESGVATPVFILQSIIKENWSDYEKGIKIMRTKTYKKFKMELDMLFYEAIAEKNAGKVEGILNEFVTSKIHKQRNKAHRLIGEFISHPAIGYAKLSWLKGIQVTIDSPLVPFDLLPIKSNDRYEDEYSFLNRYRN